MDGISNQVATVTDRAVGVGQATGTTPHLSDFVGTGALNASVELFDHGTVENLSATPVLGITTQMMSGNFTLTVTYTFTPLAPGPARVHVHATAAPGGDGTTWATAFDSLQNGLAAAGPGSEVWVTAGTYSPGTVKTETFKLPPGVTLLGGFFGDEVDGVSRDPGRAQRSEPWPRTRDTASGSSPTMRLETPRRSRE